MNCTHKPLLTLALALGLGFSSHAQTDTTSNELNLGRLRIDKDFTQSITIKGTDLEKMPFSSLAEAINVWSYGYYTQQARLRYVIDGVIMNDVNAYSPYDIDEVTLVQNALGQVSGATSQQVLVLIKTRKGGNRAKGITISGQSYLVNTDFGRDFSGVKVKSANNYSHLYQVSAYQNGKRLQYGFSASYARTVIPGPKSGKDAIQVPDNTDRLRLNAWATAQLSSNHELTLRINATPQINDYEIKNLPANYRYDLDTRTKQAILNPTISLRSKISDRLTNELTVSYGWQKGSTHQVSTIMEPNGPTNNHWYDSKNRGQQVLVMDHLSYRAPLNRDWSIEPALDFSFRYIDRNWETVVHSQTNNLPTQMSGSTTSQEGRIYLVTPSVNVRYRNSFNLQGGALANVSKTYGQNINEFLPFVSASIDLLRIARPDNPTSLKLFGSYAETENTGDQSLDLETPYFNNVPVFGPITIPVFPSQMTENSFWNWQAGARLSVFNDRLTANYTFERRNYTSAAFISSSPGGDRWIYPDIISTSHYIGINATVVDNKQFRWCTGFNATSIKSKSLDVPKYGRAYGVYGDFNSDKTAWTGGWTNRITVGRFVAGADLLYYSNPDNKQTVLQDYGKLNALALQNAYVGYNVPLKNKGNLELFVDARNLAQHHRFKMAGNRRYYGLGVKISL